MLSRSATTLFALSAAAGVTAQSASSTATATASASASASSASASVAPLEKWSWTNSTQRMHGISLGNWLLLEKWMHNDWFEEACGNATAPDQWSFIQAINDEDMAKQILQEHYETWITNDDIVNMANSGFNTLRVPVGYWSFIDPIDGTPYVNAGEVDQLSRVLEVAQQNGLYTVIDMHGMPGSQNGEQASGHVGTNGFYNDQNQQYGDQFVDAVIEFIQQSPYNSSISAVAACNEPVYYTEGQFDTLVAYYERSYSKFSAAGVPMMFHPGHPQTNALALFEGFISGKDPNLLIFETHPYPGRGASLTGTGSNVDPDALIQEVCSNADSYRGYPIPVAVTEWSLVSAIVNDTDFYARFWEAQTAAWSESGGGMFWSYKLNSSKLSDVADNRVYSFVDLQNDNIIPLPSAGQSASAYLANLTNPCSNSSTETWASPVPSQSVSVTAAFTASAN